MAVDPSPFLNAAVDLKLVRAPLTYSTLSGNADRRSDQEVAHFRLIDAGGQIFKITIGKNLDSIRRRADLFHAALPGHIPATLFFLRTKAGDIWAQDWIEGRNLEHALASVEEAARVIFALERLEHALQLITANSSWPAWQLEFTAWSHVVLDLPVWTEGERTELESILPQLAMRLRPALPRQRWSNGDFISTNIKRDREEHPILIDFEFSGQTHFYEEDRARFFFLSPIARSHPGLFSGIWEESELSGAWEMFFELRQLALEVATNTPDYVARHAPLRKSKMRLAAERSGLNLPPWASATQPRVTDPEETVQLFWQVAGEWSETHSKRVQVRRGQTQFIAFRLPAGAQSLRFDPVASIRCVEIRSMQTMNADGIRHEIGDSFSVVGATVHRLSKGFRLSPHHADPQLFLHRPASSTFFLAEILVELSSVTEVI